MAHATPETVEARFWAKVQKTSSCWTWTGAKYLVGYGKFWLDGRDTYAHRTSYEITYGAIPVGMMIDHRCRNTLCVNPTHLRTATRKQNAENASSGPRADNRSSGFRGVTWNKRARKWQAIVQHDGQRFYLGLFSEAGTAGAAARAKRNELFTHNDQDRRPDEDLHEG